MKPKNCENNFTVVESNSKHIENTKEKKANTKENIQKQILKFIYSNIQTLINQNSD